MMVAVLYEDRHCLVVAKPARLLTASDKTGDPTLLQAARAYNAGKQEAGRKGYLAPLHFLDRPVSGVVMFAASSKAASRLAEQLRAGRVRKTYLAVVEGGPSEAAGELTDWLLKDHDSNHVTVVAENAPGAKACRLGYRVLARHGGRSLLALTPHTGRSHQIRVQLSSRGWPILGDRKYGARAAFSGDELAGVIALHALSVRFAHPVGGAPTTVTAPVPPYWDEAFPHIGDHVQEA